MQSRAAHSFKLGLCGDPKCKALHFVLEDDRENQFAEMTIGVQHVPEVIRLMQALAYEIETTRKDY
jgi:hypothetical protein